MTSKYEFQNTHLAQKYTTTNGYLYSLQEKTIKALCFVPTWQAQIQVHSVEYGRFV